MAGLAPGDRSSARCVLQHGDQRTVGEIFREIRLKFRGKPDGTLEEEVMVKKLKNDARKYWDLVNKHPKIRDALDNLLHIACIWPDMRLSTIHKAFAMKCDELIVNYLQHIKSVWEYVLNYDSGLFKSMNYESMRILELTCPKASASDAESLNKLQQNLVRRRALEVDTLIPSFRSLFDDINYLELLVNTIKKLHRPEKVDSSLRESLDYIQSSQNADRAWEELFLYAMRLYNRIHDPTMRNTVLKSGDPIEGLMAEADKAQLNHFAIYTSDLGFRLRAEWRAQNSLPERTAASGGYDAERKGDPVLVTSGRNTGVKKNRRSGLPKKESHKEYWEFLWHENMHAANNATGDGITNFFVRKAVFRAFFDPWKPPRTNAADTTGDQSDCDQSLARSIGFKNASELHTFMGDLFDPNRDDAECPERSDASQVQEEHSPSLNSTGSMDQGNIAKRKSSTLDRGDIPTDALLMPKRQKSCLADMVSRASSRAFTHLQNAIYGPSER